MYTTLSDQRGAVDAAARLAAPTGPPQGGLDGILQGLPLLVDRVMAESGVVEPHVAARAISQAAGDLSRAVSLVRAWAANLPRISTCHVTRDDLRILRRITPAFRAPRDGQYLGATQDYAQRLLDFGDGPADDGQAGPDPSDHVLLPARFTRPMEALEAQGLVASPTPAQPLDASRTALGSGAGRGPMLQHLARSDTGAMTALAYSGLRGFGEPADPTLTELVRARAPIHRTHPLTGGRVVVGEITLTTAELALYRISDGSPDPQLTIGVGATVGIVEVRAIAAALLDAGLTRTAAAGGRPPSPAVDEEYVRTTLDAAEANGFTEHLKLPHHVTFTADVDAVRRVRAAGPGEPR